MKARKNETCSVQLQLPSDEEGDYLTLHPGDQCQNPVRGKDKLCLDEWHGRNSNFGIVYHLRYVANKTEAETGLYHVRLDSNGMSEVSL